MALVAVAIVVIVAGAFVGVAGAHDTDKGHSDDHCDGMSGGMMGGMMGMSNECPMHDECETMGRHTSTAGECGDSPMN